MSSEDAKRLQESVKWFNLSEELFPAGALVLAAVSGGADSMAMLSILGAIREELGFRLAVAYLDHGLRPVAAERALVETFARTLRVPLYSGEVDVPALVRESGDSIETASRKARYDFLYDVAQRITATRIATAHTQDDQVETVMMRILRGTGLRGLTGIPVRRGMIVRPIIKLRRSETRGYCKENSVPFVDDPTNASNEHLRNRVRNELLPLLEGKYQSDIDGSLLRLAENAGEVVQHVRAQTDAHIDRSLRSQSEGEWVLKISGLGSLDSTSLFVLFGDVFNERIGTQADLTRTHYEQLIAMVRDARGSGKQLHLPGYHVKREYENLIITPVRAFAKTDPGYRCNATLTLPGETRIAGYLVKTDIIEKKDLRGVPLLASPEMAYFSLPNIKLPLTLRNPDEGDRMQPFGMSGRKKLSDIFIDRKVPGRERPGKLVISDADDILWLVGVTTAEKSRVDTETDKIIRITVEASAAEAS